MRRRLLFTVPLVLLLWETGAATTPQALKTKGTGSPEQDTVQARDPLGEDHPLWGLMHLGLLPAMKLLAEAQQQGTVTTMDSEDLLAKLRRPLQGPEPDRDPLHHSLPEGSWEESEPEPQAPLRRVVLAGPEEDRDHLYHGSGDS
ncbi:proline-rich acidic protein 1 [Sorex araneus]|uniref:proline-rich acidic protein 1 n=1 Tax=Sorex araneus TaxID=42254 RepID=UPI002433D0E5|nr:proline-rich acidic protein 1 [Sorex araneus]